jgi:hypothetical protein
VSLSIIFRRRPTFFTTRLPFRPAIVLFSTMKSTKSGREIPQPNVQELGPLATLRASVAVELSAATGLTPLQLEQ